MKTKFYALILFLHLFTFFNAQTTVKVGFKDSQISVNNIPQPISSTILFGNNNTINTKFFVTLDKPNTYNIGESRLFVRLYNKNGTFTDLVTNIYIPVSTSTFQTSAIAGFDTNINSDWINYGEGNYIMASLVAVNSGATWTSPKIPVSKSPVFSISPTSVEIPCNSQNPINLTCNSNVSSGVYSYSWNVGNGWSMNGNAVSGNITTTSNSITLTPSNPNILPSSIYVTPTWNNLLQNTLSSTVRRSEFNDIEINGNNTICSYPAVSTYSINSANSSATWSVSDISVAEVANTNGVNVILNIKKSGKFTLTANITNGCGQIKTLTKNIWVGSTNYYVTQINNPNYYNESHFYIDSTIPILQQGVTEIKWTKISSPLGVRLYAPLNSTEGFATGPDNSWTMEVRIDITSSCGVNTQYITITPPPFGGCNEYKVAKSNKNNTYIIIDPCAKTSSNFKTDNKLYNITTELMDIKGKKVLSTENLEFNIDNYPNGTYYLIIMKKNSIVHKQIITKN